MGKRYEWQTEHDYDKGRRGIIERALGARAKDENWSSDEYLSSYEKPLLTHIGRPAEMGGLMYELPVNNLFGTLRNAEIRINELRKKLRDRGKYSESEGQPSTESYEKPRYHEALYLKFCLKHREGHMAGLQQSLNENGGALAVEAPISNARSRIEEGELGLGDLAMQGAALLEAAGDNTQLRSDVHETLLTNEFWQERVVNDRVTEGLEIPGWSEDDNDVLPGAKGYDLPTVPSTKIDPALAMWKSVITKSTRDRMNVFIDEQTPELAQTVVESVGQQMEALETSQV